MRPSAARPRTYGLLRSTALAVLTSVPALLGCSSCGGSGREPVEPVEPVLTPGTEAVDPGPSEEPPAAGDPAATLMAELRSRLEELADMSPDEPVHRGGDLDVRPLVGLTRAQIQAGLGAPSTCTETPVRDEQGNRLPVAPCQTQRDWFYSFYRLPDGWLGGGPELLLTFDDSDTCASADWRYTQ